MNYVASVVSFLFVSDFSKKMNSGHVNLPSCSFAKFVSSSMFLFSEVKFFYCPSACCLFGICILKWLAVLDAVLHRCAPLSLSSFFFLPTILPNHPLTGNLVFSCHMVCLSICSLPPLLLSLIRPQVYCPISLTVFLFALLLLFVHLSPLSASPPTSRPLCPVAPLSINSRVSSLSAISYPEGSVLHVTESVCFDRQGPNLVSHHVATVPSATPPSQHQPSTNTHRDRQFWEEAML